MPGGDSQPDPKPHWQGYRERLRDKLLKRGAGALEDYEVMEVILMVFMPRRDVKPIAKAMMTRLGSLSGVLAAQSADLAKIDGMGETVAAYLKAIAELQSRWTREEIRKRPAISSWSTLMTHVSTELQYDGRD